jgi:hypothetical protein
LIVPGVATEDRLHALLDSFSVVFQDIALSPRKRNPARAQKQTDPAIEKLRQIDMSGAGGRRLTVEELCRVLTKAKTPVPLGVRWTEWRSSDSPVKIWISKQRNKP